MGLARCRGSLNLLSQSRCFGDSIRPNEREADMPNQATTPAVGDDTLKIAAAVVTFVAVLATFVGPFLGGIGEVELAVMAALWVAAIGLWLTVAVRPRRG